MEVHERRVPVGAVLVLGARLAVAQGFNGEEVRGGGECFVGELEGVEKAEVVKELTRTRVLGVGEGVGGGCAAEIGGRLLFRL